jgi:hypothetical protein
MVRAMSRALPIINALRQYPYHENCIISTYQKDSMIGEEESLRDNVPSSIPRDISIINEESHELRNSECWVRLQ